jgi:hypothetical protein
VASVEDIVLAKMEWYQQGNRVSEQQWRDITGIVGVNKNHLDVHYMKQTAEELGVLDLLNSLIGVDGDYF